ncbi:hypothetical protein BGZ60DRAFT_62324 [Tricladium varicosporioides]|nr:hypothetical protein BGZ60DRAFT_62324 [Hymenoscyphus varicosporioides]
MLASHVGATLFPPTMGDDSMEISSEHGHNEGDDIDIDIDFTAGPADEDAILEDATSNIGFGEERQASPTVGHDDIMIDEGEDTYQMNDEDLVLDDGDQRMEPEVVTESFSLGGSSHFEDEQMLAGGMPSSDSHNMWAQENAELSTESQDINVEDLRDSVHQEVEVTENEVAGDIRDSMQQPSDHGSQVSTPRANEFITEVPETETVTPIGLEQENQPATDNKTPSNLSPIPTDGAVGPEDEESEHGHFEDELYEDPTLENEEPGNDIVATHSEESSTTPHVVVAYRNEEFPLFPTTNSDDPNHFFISDLAILDKGLGELLTALRNVIYEDIPDDQELTINFTDFKFEIDESCARLDEFTLGQIIELYNKLLHNENVETRPLYILLDFRPRYTSRIRNLMMGAAEGKILSDLIPWIDGDENSNESGPENGSIGSDELVSEELALGEFKPEENAESLRVEESMNKLTENSVKEGLFEAEDVHKLSPKQDLSPEAPQGPKLNNYAAEDQSLIRHSPPNDSQQSEAEHATCANVKPDEDDLIDYSDDEEQANKEHVSVKSTISGSQADDIAPNNGILANFFQPCILPQSCICSKCITLLHAEYDTINESLRLRSESLKAENRRRSIPSVAGSNGANYLRDDVQRQIDFKDSVAGGLHDNDNEGEEHENEGLTTDDTLVAAEDEEEYDDQNHDTVSNQPYGLEAGAFTEEDYQDELGEDNYNANDGDESFQDHEKDLHDDQEVEGDEIDLNGFFEESNPVPHAADTAESSVTVEDDENYPAEADQQNTGDHEDEIDYEDDDDKEQCSPLVQSPPQATNGGSIKRSLAEVEDDDAGSPRGQDAKRPRS